MAKIITRISPSFESFDFETLTLCISSIHSALQSSAVNAVNRFATIRNWLIGHYIVEYEQCGNDRAKYGSKLLAKIADKLSSAGINSTLLKNARRFYITYPHISEIVTPICPMLSDKFPDLSYLFNLTPTLNRISPTASDKFITPATTIISKLSFSHIVELLTIEDPLIRFFYEFECIRNVWSVKELRKQISSNLHIRVGLSKSPEKVIDKLSEIIEQKNSIIQIKDPFTLEFLGLDVAEYISESDLENSLISNLQEFLLELGKGFCFEARQKRMIIDDRYYFADLVFYNRLLHCSVIIELKNDEFKHEYLGQLNAYVSYYRENEMQPDDNPPVGILLCTRKGKRMVEYALAGMDNSLFVSTYQLCLPDKHQLETFLENAID